ncbi:MAG: tetratricopeptide repeat protein [Hyphomicrobium sp.]
MIAFAGVLVWQVATKSLAAYLAVQSPEMALNLHATQPAALVSLADRRLNPPPTNEGPDAPGVPQQALADKTQTSQDGDDRISAWAELALKAAAKKLPLRQTDRAKITDATTQLAPPPVLKADRNQARAEAELALVHDPLNARALRLLGQLAEGAGDDTKAAQFMQAAAHRSWSESVAIYWLMLKSFENKDHDAALRYADAFLRKRPQFIAQAMPILARIAENKDQKAVGGLKTLMMSDPPWRSKFFLNLPKNVTDARTPLELLLSVKDTASPPTVAELRAYLNILIKRKFYELAYYTWLQFLPPEQLGHAGFLANGSFEATPSGLPFDWVISKGSSGVTTDIAVRPELDGERALYLEFGPGRADFRGVSQLLMLAPGTYELKGTYKGEISGRRGLQWSIACANAPRKPVAESRMFLGTARTWTDFLIPFTVPDKGCRAQTLHLSLAARSESERLVSGSIWYDEMQISRVEKRDGAEQTQKDNSPKQAVQPIPEATTTKRTEKSGTSPGSDGRRATRSNVGQ